MVAWGWSNQNQVQSRDSLLQYHALVGQCYTQQTEKDC